MALRYWVGGSGTWNTTSTTNWSATSGGPGGASAPTVVDDVIFNSASSGASYVVTCAGGVCQSITTSAPATGTLSFNDPSFLSFFTVYSGNINIHAACLFTSTGTITHLPQVNGTYTTTFNGSGTNTLNVTYVFSSTSTGVSLNFCNSTTSSFTFVQIDVRGTLTCTNAAITVGGTAQSSRFGYANSTTSAAAVTMTGTTLNAGTSAQVGAVYIGGAQTTSWAISTLNINISNIVMIGGTEGLFVGQGASTQPSAMGAVTITFSTTTSFDFYNLFFTRATSVTCNAPLFGTNNLRLISNLTITGALVLNANCIFVNNGFTVSVGGTTTLGDRSLYSSANNSASTTFVGAVTATSGGFAKGPFFLRTDELVGSLTFSAGITTSPVGTDTAFIFANNIVADAMSLTNTFVFVGTSLTVNGGVGKAFSYTINGNPTVREIIIALPDGSTIFNNEFPSIRARTATITTPTTSFVGTNVRRVVYGSPRNGTKTTNDTLTISGSTPTLTNVTFLGTTINNGTSNFSGTRLGTDGLSSGFFAAAGVQKFVVAAPGSSVNYDGAIWALTSGGATSADNYPLPQDTIVFGPSATNSTVAYSGQLYIGTVSMSVAGTFLTDLGFGAGTVYSFGDINITGSAAFFGIYSLFLVQSGNNNRYVTNTQGVNSDVKPSSFIIDTANTTNLAVSGIFSALRGLYVYSGTNEYLSGSQFGSSSSLTFEELTFFGGINTPREVTFIVPLFTIQSGAVINTSNYTVRGFRNPSFRVPTYVNNAVATALNGSIVLTSTTQGYTATITGTSATNPLKSLQLISTVAGFPTPTLSLSTGSIFLESFTTGTNTGWNLQDGGGVRGFVKTNGGTVSVANVFVDNCTASPANTFYATGSSTLSGITTGWTLGAAPASPPSGGFIFF